MLEKDERDREKRWQLQVSDATRGQHPKTPSQNAPDPRPLLLTPDLLLCPNISLSFRRLRRSVPQPPNAPQLWIWTLPVAKARHSCHAQVLGVYVAGMSLKEKCTCQLSPSREEREAQSFCRHPKRLAREGRETGARRAQKADRAASAPETEAGVEFGRFRRSRC